MMMRESEMIDPATLRLNAFRRGRQILEGLAGLAPVRVREGVQRPGDVLLDIQETYDYDPWDIALLGALTGLLHPRTRLPQLLRDEASRITRERRQFLQALRTLQKKFMTGDRPTVSCIQAVLAPRPAVGLVLTTGRPAEWVLNEFAGAVLVVLGQTRAAKMPEPPLEPIGLAFGFGCELLRSIGIRATRRSLEERARALPNLPPPPNDDAPLDWAEALTERLTRVPEASDILRRVFAPDDATPLPLTTIRYRMTARSPEIIARRFTRRALPPKP